MDFRKELIFGYLSGKKKPWYLNGLPTPVAVYQPLGATSYEASKVNIINPGLYDLQEVGGYSTWSAGLGWTGRATYCLNTGISLLSTYTVICRVDASVANRYLFVITNGAYSADTFGFAPRWPDYGGEVKFASEKDSNTSGVGDNVIGVAGVNAYINGVAKLSNAAVPSGTLRIFSEGTTNTYHIVKAVVVYGEILSAAKMALVSAAMAALP